MKNIIILTIIFALLLLSSCTTSRNRSAGKLSDAMEKSSDDYEGERKIKAVVTEDEEDEDEYDGHGGYNGDTNYHNENPLFVTYEKEQSTNVLIPQDQWLGFQFGTGFLSSESFYGLSSFSLTGNMFTSKKRSLSYEFGFDYSPLQTAEIDLNDSTIVNALEGGIVSLHAGFQRRFYVTPKHTFLGNYYSLGARVHAMFWEYKNELEVIEYDEYDNPIGTDYVKHDHIWGVDLNAAVGFNLMQFKHLRIGVEFNPGITIWWFDTYQGFTNDVFAPFVYLKTNFRFLLGG
ncbi:MAG: hypothetical protein GQ534_04310 [Candidatus Delongbacteria bacterium]|nr:hypothetical protein [Candidatus Delongbacteria bacterium]